MVHDKSWLHQVWKRLRHSTISERPAPYASFRVYFKNAVRTRSERLVTWIQNRQCQHYGRTARNPGLFQRRDLPFFALHSGHLRIKASPPLKYHDLLDAAANVGVLEARLGYTFKNRMTCLEALKISGESYPLYYDGTVYTIGGNRRLALLGDRVLSLVLCEIWFQTEHSNKEHFLMSRETVSRAALAITGGAIDLRKSMMAPDDNNPNAKAWDNRIAETFEAVLGAVYVDSNYDIKAVKAIISRLKLDDHQFLKTRAKVGIAQITPVLLQSVDEQAVLSASRTQITASDVQDSTRIEEQGPDELSSIEKPKLVVLEELAKSSHAQTAEAAIRASIICKKRARTGEPFDPVAVYDSCRTYLRRVNRGKARAERQAEEILKKTQEKSVASEGVQQEARKATATNARKVAHERDGGNGEDRSKIRTDRRKQDNDKSRDSTEPRKPKIQQLPTPATEEFQGAKLALQRAPKETTNQETLKSTRKRTRTRMLN
jgi:dsRNA-specific ribonuclease